MNFEFTGALAIPVRNVLRCRVFFALSWYIIYLKSVILPKLVSNVTLKTNDDKNFGYYYSFAL